MAERTYVALGEGIDWSRSVSKLVVDEKPDPTLAELQRVAALLELLLSREPVVPQVVVDAPPVDLTALLLAVEQLKLGGNDAPTANEVANEVANAVTEAIVIPDANPALATLAALMERVEHRLQGVGPAFGASGPSNISDNPNRKLGRVTVDNPTANPETGLAKDATFAKDDDGGIKAHVQNFPATQIVSGTVAVLQTNYTRSDTYAAVGSGVTVNATANPPAAYALQVKGTGGAATAWDVRLEGSLDGVDWTQILSHMTTTIDGTTVFSNTARSPALFIRSRCASLTLGTATDIRVTLLAVRSA